MPRYESGKDKSRRFWEISVVKNVLHTRHGRVGSDGRANDPKVFESADAAQKEAAKRIADKVKKQFERVDDDVSGHALNEELWAMIVQNPEADEPYLVYGDWLQSQGDGRGELVTLAHRLRDNRGDADLQKRAAMLQTQLTPTRLMQMLKKKQNPQKAASGYCAVEWRYGFIDKARIGRNTDRPPYTVRELVVALLTHPSAQVLRSLVIGALGPVNEYDYSAVMAEIVALAPASLRELVIADFAAEHAELAESSLGDVSGLYPALPGLARLHLRGGHMELGHMDLPALRELAITASVFDSKMLDSVASGWFPVLHRLELCGGGGALPSGAMTRLAAAPGMAALRHLGLMDIDGTIEVLQDEWVGSELFQRLHVLDLSGGSLTDRDAERLLGQRQLLAHLQELNLERNYFSDDAAAALGGICSRVRLGDQRPLAGGPLSVTEQQLLDFAPDTRSIAAARKLAKLASWPSLGRNATLLWGRCQGREVYDVYVDAEAMESGCTCPSMKYPCKHAIGLLLLAQSAAIAENAPPEGFVEGCEARLARLWDD